MIILSNGHFGWIEYLDDSSEFVLCKMSYGDHQLMWVSFKRSLREINFIYGVYR